MQVGTVTKDSQAPEKRASASFHFHNGKHILIGGGGRSKEYNDVWSLDYNKQSHELAWTKIEQQSGIAYTPRTGQASALCGNKVFIYGGQNYQEQKMHGDAFLYDIENNTWESLSGKNKPEDRNSCTVNYDAKRNRVILFGGANLSGPLNDVYAFDLEKKEWQKLETSGSIAPKGREMHGAVIYSGKLELPDEKSDIPVKQEKTIDLNFLSGIEGKKADDQPDEQEAQAEEEEETKNDEETVDPNAPGEEGTFLIVFGGREGEEFSQDILCLNLETLKWKYLGTLPFPICAHSCELAKDKVFIFGGTDGMQFLDNLYYFSLATRQWHVYKVGNNSTTQPRISASMSYNPDNEGVLSFGGCSYEDELNEILIVPVSKEGLKKNFQKLKLDTKMFMYEV